MASQVALVVKNSLANAGECKRCRFNPWVRKAWQPTLEEGMTTHSSILAWRIPRTEKPGGLQSIGSQRRYSSKASILWHSAFFMIQLTSVHDYWKKHTIVSKVMSFSVCQYAIQMCHSFPSKKQMSSNFMVAFIEHIFFIFISKEFGSSKLKYSH